MCFNISTFFPLGNSDVNPNLAAATSGKKCQVEGVELN